MSLEHIIVDVTLRAQNEWCVLFTCDFVSYGREGKLHPVRDRSYLEVESEMGANVLLMAASMFRPLCVVFLILLWAMPHGGGVFIVRC